MPKSERIGDAPIQPEAREQMRAIAQTLDEFLNEKQLASGKPRQWGFLVMMFPFDDGPGRCNYISNASRDDVIVLMQEQLSRFQGFPEQSGKG